MEYAGGTLWPVALSTITAHGDCSWYGVGGENGRDEELGGPPASTDGLDTRTEGYCGGGGGGCLCGVRYNGVVAAYGKEGSCEATDDGDNGVAGSGADEVRAA